GHEYGTTTGRPRRCGWFDAVAARTVVKINGMTDIALTKLDVLDTFASVKVCHAYRIGKRTLDVFPADARDVESVVPTYETRPGWKEATTGRRLEDLPRPAVDYIRHLESLVSCPIHLVSLGPERSAMVRIPRGPASVLGA
ncbi:MAG TPA: adenylosuccinate synthetase, partial [Candidatus Krumholzibacteria bacterium]|nr:adenylosuccinate synthetase [Candidatus Krumholzibacteria bacterium]